MQDAMLSAFVHLKDFDGKSRFATWLTRIGINSALMLLRKRRGRREICSDVSIDPSENKSFWDVRDSSPNPESSCLQREREEVLRRAIGDLRPGIRDVLVLGQLREHSMKQTAGIVGISIAAAKGRLFHARRALRNSKILRTVCRARPTRRASRSLGSLNWKMMETESSYRLLQCCVPIYTSVVRSDRRSCWSRVSCAQGGLVSPADKRVHPQSR